MFYPILVERNSVETIEIRTAPGRKNMSQEPCIEGWLGTTNNVRRDALGEFDSLEACKAAMLEQYNALHDLEVDDYSDAIEIWGIGRAPTVDADVSRAWVWDAARDLAKQAKAHGMEKDAALEWAKGQIDCNELQDAGGGDVFFLDADAVASAIEAHIEEQYSEEE